MTANGVNVQLTASTTQASAALKNISNQIDRLAGMSTSASRRATDFLIRTKGAVDAVSSAVSMLAKVATAPMREFSSAARQTITMQATVKALGSACAVTSKDILEFADALSQSTTYDDDAIVGVQQLLLATRNLSKEGLQQATEAAIDMAAAMGTDAKSAAASLARALADPADNMRALRSLNIQFTDAEEDQIKTLQESGKLWESQQVILDRVKDVYGGVAKAVADTDVGKLDKIVTATGNLAEALGGGIVDVISPYLDGVYGKIVSLQNWIERHTDRSRVDKVLESGGDLTKFGSGVLADSRDDYLSQMQAIEAKGLLKRDSKGELIDPSARLRQWDVNGNEGPMPVVSFAEVDAYKQYAELSERYSRLQAAFVKVSAIENAPKPSSPDFSGSGAGTATSPSLAQYGSLSPSYQIHQKQADYAQATLQWAKAEDPQEKQYWDEIRKALREQVMEMLKPSGSGSDSVVPATSAIGSFLSAHSGMSTTMQVADIDSQLAQARELQAKGGMSDQEADSIQEVIDKLQEQKDGLLGISDANEQVRTGAEKYAEAYAASTKYISQATQMLGSFFDLYDQLLSNDVDSLDKQLSDAEERWDKYFDNLERKQDTQKSSLAAMYDEGLISAEDYTSALEDLDEQYTQSQSEREAEEEELQKEADKAKEKQFNANKLNSIAQVLIQGAQATAAVWANPGWPAAIPLTVMLGAMNTAQVAAIASQKYTPMAVGGIVQSPTHAYIGEGAEAEAVMPLSHLSRMLSSQGMDANGGGVINISISMGDVYDPDQIAEQVYQGINRAQERGMLPAWSVR